MAEPNRRPTLGLLPKILIAIILGIACGLFFPDRLVRVFDVFAGSDALLLENERVRVWDLILAPGESTKTVTLGAQMFIGQFVTNWNAVLAALTLAILPVLVLYLIFSRQLIRGITAGAVK